MKIIKNFLSSITIVVVSLVSVACTANTKAPVKIDVNKTITAAIHSISSDGNQEDIIYPPLLEENLHISQLIYYFGDEGVTMPFNFSDTAGYKEITENHLDKRIAISINGQVIAKPVVKISIDNGACSVVLNEEQLKNLFPDIMIDELMSD